MENLENYYSVYLKCTAIQPSCFTEISKITVLSKVKKYTFKQQRKLFYYVLNFSTIEINYSWSFYNSSLGYNSHILQFTHLNNSGMFGTLMALKAAIIISVRTSSSSLPSPMHFSSDSLSPSSPKLCNH
jgi:hypothetical protein